MTISTQFTVNGSIPAGAVAISPGSAAFCRVVDPTGIGSFVWSIEGTDDPAHAAPDILVSGSPYGSVASVTIPPDYGDGLGQSYIIQCLGNDGKSPPSQVTYRVVVGVRNPVGNVPLAANEDFERSTTHGWVGVLNKALSNASVSTTTSVASIAAVATEPGWNVIGTFPWDLDISATLDVIGSVSDASLTMTVRVYCVTTGSVGEVSGSRVTLTSTTDARQKSTSFSLVSGSIYQIQAEVVGAAGDSFFGLVRRAVPLPMLG